MNVPEHFFFGFIKYSDWENPAFLIVFSAFICLMIIDLILVVL